MTARLLAVVLFSAAAGAALMAVWLWHAWRPANCRCPVHGLSSRPLPLNAHVHRGSPTDSWGVPWTCCRNDHPTTEGGGESPPTPAAALAPPSP